MLNMAANVNRKLKSGLNRISFRILTQNSGTPISMIVQICEIQGPFRKDFQKVKRLVNAVREAEKTLKWIMTIE
jgi:hypothetical protein